MMYIIAALLAGGRFSLRPKSNRSLVYNWRLWLLMGSAVFGTTAFECATTTTNKRLAEINGEIYAIGHDEQYGSDEYVAIYEPETGSWALAEDIPGAVSGFSSRLPDLPITQCAPELPSTCYRIEGDERVLESVNGGKSWRTAWEVPLGRRLYMARTSYSCVGGIDIGPYDLLISGSGEEYLVFVAAGNQGALVRYSDGTWERQRVLASPLAPYRGSGLGDIFIGAIFEHIVFLFFVIALGFYHSVYFLRRPILFLISPVLMLLMTGLWIGATGDYSAIPFLVIFFIIQIIGIGIFAVSYKGAGDKRKIIHRDKADQALLAVMMSTIGLWLVGVFIIALWVTGIIPVYWLMMALLVGTAVWVTRWSMKVNHRLLAESNALMGEYGRKDHVIKSE